MRLFLRGMSIAVVLGLFALAISYYAYLRPRTYMAQTLTIPPHTGARATLALLHDAGITPSTSFIALPVLLSRAPAKLKAGEYAFESGLSPAQIIAKITRGDVVIHKITIPEGWTSFQVRDALNAEPLLTGEAMVTIPEGSILPDTVRFTRNELRTVVLARMQAPQAAFLAAQWNARAPDLPLATPREALVLASIVERETGVPAERPLVAGVFINRLRRGMALQTDPTVAYGIVAAHQGQPMSHPLTLDDLHADTVYNTYTRPGLPPTPICNPGREAVQAALHPAATDALYFVATGHGGHTFAATLEDHARNVAVYRQAIAAASPKIRP